MRGVLQDQRVFVLIDGGDSHNFIDLASVKIRHIRTIELEGFCVELAGGNTMPCDRYIPSLSLTLGRHDLAQDFYVMELPDTIVIFGVQWLSTLGAITANYKTMEMSFNGENVKRVTLREMSGNAPRVVTTKHMEAIFKREDIVYAAKCLISIQLDKEGHPHYSHDIQCYHPKLHVDGLAVEPPKMNKLLFKFRVQKSSQAPWSLVHSSNFRISITRREL
jgi:hypothetical protein